MRKSQLIFTLFMVCFAWACFGADITELDVQEQELLQQAESGDAKDAFNVACFYEHTGRADYPTIVLWLKRSANKGYLEAQFALGKIYHFGKPKVLRNLKESEYWYEKAAAQGDQQALQNLEIVHSEPDYKLTSVPDMDEKWNMQWTVKMASYGDKQSQFQMGQMYLEGVKIRMDYEQAAAWFEKAAVQGHIEAMFALANLYADGKGFPVDLQKAVFWYEQAASRDYMPAQKKLSKILSSTEYRTPDLVRAAGWLYISLRQLFPDEKDLTKVSPELENLFSQLTEQQKEDALYFAYSFLDRMKQ